MACKNVHSSVVADLGSRWLNTNVKFAIAEHQYTGREVGIIAQAMNKIQEVSCVRFEQIPVRKDDAVFISKEGSFCAADCGRRSYQGSHQRLMLGSVCFKAKGLGIAIHELLHIIGFYHEQMRSDRDQYLNIVYANIIPKFLQNFNKVPDKEIDLLDSPYDYGSIMHYAETDFSVRKGLVTLEALKPVNGQMGQRNGLTELDILKINRAYSCGGAKSLAVYPNKWALHSDISDLEDEELDDNEDTKIMPSPKFESWDYLEAF